MNNIYIDSNAKNNGDGSLNMPYNNFSSLLSMSTINHPVTINIKRGSKFYGLTQDSNSIFYNKTDEVSYIKPYGYGANPEFHQADDGNYCFVILYAKNIIISGLKFIGVFNGQNCVSVKPCRTEKDENANVWIEDCIFCSKIGESQSFNMALRMNGDNGPVIGRVSRFGERRNKYIGTPRGSWLIGSSLKSSGNSDNNNGDRNYGYGIRSDYCSYLDVPGDGCIISNACSKNDVTSAKWDDDTSGWIEPYYHCTRLDMQNNASVPFWGSNCNRFLMYRPIVKYNYSSLTGFDKYAFDFDIQCWDCLIEQPYSEGCAGILLTSNYAGQVEAIPSGVTTNEWYFTRRFGNGNNTIRNGISFNDGVSPTKPKVLWQGYTYNLRLQNMTIIDNISPSVSIATLWQESKSPISPSDGQLGLILDSVSVYAKNADVVRVLNTDTGSNTGQLTKVSFTNIYTNKSVSPIYDQGIIQLNNLNSDPQYLNLPMSAPSSLKLAMSIDTATSSPLRSKGQYSDYPDYHGNKGSSIGCVQY